jgi:hypothetical protein
MENVRNSSRIPQHGEVENALIDIDFSTNTGKECARISNVDTPANLYRDTQTQRSLTYFLLVIMACQVRERGNNILK